MKPKDELKEKVEMTETKEAAKKVIIEATGDADTTLSDDELDHASGGSGWFGTYTGPPR